MSRNGRKKDTSRRDHIAGGDGKDRPIIIVGIGVGSGGLKPLKRLLPGLPAGQGAAYVLIRHPESPGKKLTVRQAGKLTAMAVVEAKDGMPVLADRIHVMPSGKFLNIAGGVLTLREPIHCNGLWMPIDHFFCSLAADQRNRGCGIVLSGDGRDGALGLSEIRTAGGKTIVEDPKTAVAPDMPVNAVRAGVADMVLPVEDLSEKIASLVKQFVADVGTDSGPHKLDADLRAVLDIVRVKVGHDFHCYKPNTLVRRIRRRMALGNVATYADYVRFIDEHPGEVGLLQKDLLIGVTDFFRQPQAWEMLEGKVVVPLVANAPQESEIRVWVPGCSTGKEAYSLAMLLIEQTENSGKKVGIQIFATDSDVGALDIARNGSYAKEEIEGSVSHERLKRFFARKDGRYQIDKEVREKIVFAPQNITADPPFSRLDLISCRNLLMYLDRQVQQKIIALFHFALREGGFLFLGTAETVGDREDLFEPVSKKWRIYRRIGVGRPAGIEIPVRPAGDAGSGRIAAPSFASRLSLTAAAQQMLLDRFAPACVMIDRKLQVLYVHGPVEDYLTFPPGEQTMRVVDMAREGLRVRLRGAIVKCLEGNRPVSVAARVRRGGKSVPVKTTVSTIRYPRETDGLLLVSFEDYRLPAKARRGAEKKSDFQQLEDELKITREELQSTIDQLEGSNDQLKASHEEVTASNEELQSANEELETSKEELQSLNEELNTINARLQEKVEELESTNNDVVNLLSSTNIATVFLDKELKVKRYTPAVTRLMSLISTDVGRPVADILLRFTDETLLDDARRVLADLAPLAREIHADDDRWFTRRILPYRTQDDYIEGVVITFVDFTDLKRVGEELSESRRRLSVIVDSIADGFYALDREWRFTHINDSALRHMGKKRKEVLGRTLFEVFPSARSNPVEIEFGLAMEKGEPRHFENPSLVTGKMLEIHAYPGPEILTILFRDVTERHRMVKDLQEARERAEWLARFPEENPSPVVRVSADGIALYCNPAAAKLSGWACEPGLEMPEFLTPLVSRSLGEEREIDQDVELGSRVYSVSVVPFSIEGYANIYGRDVTERKRAEEKLRKSEEKFVKTFQSNPACVGLSRLKDGLVIEANEVMLKLLGYEKNEFIGHSIVELGVWNDLADRERVLQTLAACGRSMNQEYRLRTKTGELLLCNHSAELIQIDDEPHIIFTFFDITERKRAEVALRRSEGRWNAAIENFAEGAIIATEDEQVIYWNPAARAMHGFTNAGEGIGPLKETPLTFKLLTPDGSRMLELDEWPMKRIKRGESVRNLELRIRRPDQGWEKVFSYSGAMVETAGGERLIFLSVYDLTEQREAEAALRKAKNELGERVRERTAELRVASLYARSLIEASLDPLVTISADGKVTDVNKTTEEVTGRTREQIIGTDFSDYFTEPEKARAGYEEVFSKGFVRDYPLAIRHVSGRVTYVLYNATTYLNEKGEIQGVFAAARDVTALRKVQDALQRSHDELEQRVTERTAQLEAANKELESFAYSVSHDMRAPLRAIDGFSKMLIRDVEDKLDDEEKRKFNVIRDNAQKMGQLIDDLLDFSRLGRQAMSMSVVDMGDLVHQAWKECLAINHGRHIELKMYVLPGAFGDRTLIKQVLSNLLSNAVKFTGLKDDAMVEVGGRPENGENVYYVKDNGAGFDMRYYDKLFGVFQRLHSDDEYEGTGVGLAIVKRIVHRHGGRVWAEGKEGEGATFYFTLPKKGEKL